MFYREEKDGLTLFVRLKPKAGKDAVTGVEQAADGKVYLHVRVRSAPENGRANKALLRLLANKMKMPAGAFSLAAGAVARFKQVHVSGDHACLARLCDETFQMPPQALPRS